MPIHTVVASLVLIYLRDEINITRRRICALRDVFNALEGSLILINDDITWVDSGLRPVETYDQSTYAVSRIEIDERWDNWDDYKNMFDGTRDQIIEYESYVQYIIDSYNKLLTLVNEKKNVYQSLEKLDDPRCICQWGRLNTTVQINSRIERELKLCYTNV